jgi:hypothetical protein
VGKGTHDEYRDASGAVRVESWSITGMSHGVSVNPSAGCGTAAAYVIDEGLCSTQKAAEFFGLVAPSAPAPGPQPGPAAGGAAGVSPAGGGSVAAESDCDP